MEKKGKNYQLANLNALHEEGRRTLHEQLALTGTEISINQLPAGVSVPFVHAHQRNEEVYIVLEGKGKIFIDGDELDITAGDVFRIDPAGARCLRADHQSSIKFICIQAEANSLVQFTENDGIPVEVKVSWLQ